MSNQQQASASAEIEDFGEHMAEDVATNLKAALPGVYRALDFMRAVNVAVMDDLPLGADEEVRTARAQIKAIDALRSDLAQFAETGTSDVEKQIKQRVGRPNRR